MSSELFNLGSTASSATWLIPGSREAIFTAADALPPVPEHLNALHLQLGAMPINLEKVTELIRGERFLRWHLLRVCGLDSRRSAHLGLEHAILLLGAERLRHLAIACALIAPQECDPRSAAFGFAAEAGMRAMVSQQIAVDLGYQDAESAYIAALLKELGRNFVVGTLGSHVSGKGRDQAIAEAGAWMAALWNMPIRMVEVIRGTSTPGTDDGLLDIVRWADIVCRSVAGASQRGSDGAPVKALQNALKVHLIEASEAQCGQVAEFIWERFSDLLSVISQTH